MLKWKHLFLLVQMFISVISDKSYGSFNLTVTGVDICKGPKYKNCSSMTVQVTGHNLLHYDLNVTQDVVLTKIKAT
uniref:Uncharacterized protein n=1 Tax=Heliothis virescens TaxID=7102 RepID=A0A2A4JHW6_HELVI